MIKTIGYAQFSPVLGDREASHAIIRVRVQARVGEKQIGVCFLRGPYKLNKNH